MHLHSNTVATKFPFVEVQFELFGKALTLSCSLLAAAALSAAAPINGLRSFHLPVEAHWGNVVLEPGDYSLSLPSATNPAPYVQVAGRNKTVVILVATTNIGHKTEKSYLSLVRVKGVPVVSEFHAGDTGRSFRFPAPKCLARQTASGKNVVSAADSKQSARGSIEVR